MVDGAIDLGAYQYTPGALVCGFSADTVSGLTPLAVQFTSVVGGVNTIGLSYYWDLTGDGFVDSTVAHPQFSYLPGTYTVTLTVSNAAGEGAVYTRPDYIQSGPHVCFVSTNSAPSFPYDTWETAAGAIQPALDAAIDGTLIRVGDGVYTRTTAIDILKGITIRSENGLAATTLNLNGSDGVRVLYLNHPDAMVDRFTLTRSSAWGGGVSFGYFGGTLQNCAILNGKHNNSHGANLVMNAGTVRNTIVAFNANPNGGAYTNWYRSGGTVTLPAGDARLALHDLTGFEGRCDAILFSADPAFVPPNDAVALPAMRRHLLRLPQGPDAGGRFDLVVVGGGLAGMCAAVSAARSGLTAALVQDRPVFGGNNSAEVRVGLGGETNLAPFPRIGNLVAEIEATVCAAGGKPDMASPGYDAKRAAWLAAESGVTVFAPYRALYSRNRSNLFMAGRDVSVTHEALGTVRVMRTCGMMGEVVGLAAALCMRLQTPPRALYAEHWETLKHALDGGVPTGFGES